MKARRRQRRSFARFARFWAVGIVALAILFGVTLVLIRLPQFSITKVRIVPGAHTSVAQVSTAAGISVGSNIWLTDTAAASKRVEKLPWVASAQIDRRLPGEIEIRVTERTPVAIVSESGGFYLIDDALRVLAQTSGAHGLPQIDLGGSTLVEPGLTLSAAAKGMADLRLMVESGVAVRSIGFDRFGDIRVQPKLGPQLLLPSNPEELKAASTLIAALLERAMKEHRRVLVIDLRAPEAPVFRY